MKFQKVFIVLISIGVLLTGYTVYSFNKEPNHSTTFSARVLKKAHNGDKFTVQVQDTENKNRQGNVIIKSENVWNLIEKNKRYFIVVSYKSDKLFSEGPASLQQIDKIK
ncbi:hypothetical protein LCY76_16545 [Fictibacillus sp. KIGAM418]|uniref:Uncharacterized protein n=1 Tax=Fictibacillus marinisediminis TaxID=2878389 RepID=A0A9X1XE68_9BACL|nr:hypothetical protein [Fictibacillus marinisediminis]MCK6258185.1 hypothetical protein [Fictibacillus marinisediminis]